MGTTAVEKKPVSLPCAEERRRYPRSRCSEMALLRVKQDQRKLDIIVKVVDCSETGLGLQLPVIFPLPVGGTARLTPLGKNFLAGKPVDVDLVRVAEKGGTACCGARLPKLQAELRAGRTVWFHRVAASLMILALLALIPYLKMRNIVSFWYDPLLQAYSMLAGFYVISRILLSMLYRNPRDAGILKSISIVLPVKNEEANIEEVIRRCFQARYPSGLLELIVIDDGSTDKTWEVLQRVAPQYPRLTIHKFDKNRGKRHAMAWGAQRAKSEILIFMDSDSMVDPEGFYRIIQPFHDERVAAVAGHTDIIIDPKHLISKIEAVRYFVSQRVIKAAESVFGAVTCCPGPFSAYRREAVLDVLPGWLNQQFLGAAATFGDDRSLTNRILQKYRVIYHAGACCRTFAPETWRIFLKQQLRWKKSWARETLAACRHMWREHPIAALSYYASVVITLVSPLVVLRAFVWAPIAMGTLAATPYILGLMLVFLLLGAIYYYHTQSRYWYYGLVFAAIYSWIFSIQTYYAILTVRENHWGTR